SWPHAACVNRADGLDLFRVADYLRQRGRIAVGSIGYAAAGNRDSRSAGGKALEGCAAIAHRERHACAVRWGRRFITGILGRASDDFILYAGNPKCDTAGTKLIRKRWSSLILIRTFSANGNFVRVGPRIPGFQVKAACGTSGSRSRFSKFRTS